MFENFGKKKYKNISPLDAKQHLDNNKNIILIDVRSPEEYAAKHIPNSKSVPVDQLAEKISNFAKNKDNDELIVYCLSGARASKACSLLDSMGYKNVYNMGGIQNWPYETTK